MYNGTPISFNSDKGVMVNATEMAKAFGKRPSKWLELPSTQEFLSELGAIRKSDRLVSTINGVGTWFHEDVALEFARWLSPTFSIWCNDRIKELLQHGVSTVRNDDEAIAYAMNVLSERLKASQEREKQLANTNENQRIQLGIQDAEIRKAAPKVEYYDKVMQSNCTMTTTQIANGLGMPQTEQVATRCWHSVQAKRTMVVALTIHRLRAARSTHTNLHSCRWLNRHKPVHRMERTRQTLHFGTC